MLVIQFWGKWHQRAREPKEIEKATNGCLSDSVVNLKDKRVKTKWKTKKKKNKTYRQRRREMRHGNEEKKDGGVKTGTVRKKDYAHLKKKT